MERREFLRQAAVSAAGLMLTEPEKEIVDSRLTQKVTCAFKGTALSDLCEKLKSDTGIQVTAGPSVADEKVTLFCEKLPLREVMRQLSRPFGYTWLRSGTPGQYRYELVQDLRSQLLEEELRNRDRNAALLDMDREMSHYRPYLDLSPDGALARAASASGEEKKLLEYLAGKGWGPAQLYSRLTPGDLAALRAGQRLIFSAAPGPGELPLPPDMAREVICTLRGYRIVQRDGHYEGGPAQKYPDGVPPASLPEAQPIVSLRVDYSDVGHPTLRGFSGLYIGARPDDVKFQVMGDDDRDLASGMSPAARSPENAAANARFGRDPALAADVAVRPVAQRPSPNAGPAETAQPSGPHPPYSGVRPRASSVSRVTSADVLEALHHATGMPIIADYYTRLYPASQVSVQNTRLFDALNRLADTMRMRWRKDEAPGKETAWLQFRSTSFYDDRIKEVPNRLLARWAAARRQNGLLPLDELLEIAQLPDPQLDGAEMAEGARELWGLEEWEVARNANLRGHLRYLAHFTPEQRQIAARPEGLGFTRMTLAQQQEFLTRFSAPSGQMNALDDLKEASLQVDYIGPGQFQWTSPAHYPSPWARTQPPPRVRERTRQAALLAAPRIDPQVTEEQITSTEVSLTLTYRLGPKARLTPFVIGADSRNTHLLAPHSLAP